MKEGKHWDSLTMGRQSRRMDGANALGSVTLLINSALSTSSPNRRRKLFY